MRAVFYIVVLLGVFACSGIQPRYHEVSSGETLAKIATSYQVPVAELEKHNKEQLADGLKPGSKLYIPFEENPTWNAPAEATEAPPSIREVAAAEPAYDVTPADFAWPVSGTITSGFGHRHIRGHRASREHEGIDIGARRGMPVHASRSGHVIYAGNRISGYGNMIIVKHADSYSTVYAHLSRMYAHKGQFVTRGQKIGAVGKTGRAYGYHLHFEIRRDRDPVNPLLYLQGQYATNTLNR